MNPLPGLCGLLCPCFRPAVVLLLSIVFGPAVPTPAGEASPDGEASPLVFDREILRAGNAADDRERLKILQGLAKDPSLNDARRTEVERLVREVDRWIREKRLDYFGREVSRTRDFDFGISEDSPLQSLTWIYRGRMLTWLTLENGGIWRHRERRREFLDRARDFFERASRAFPENPVLKMYLGKPIPPRKRYPPVEGPPRWALHQREALERLADIMEWWIDHRMQADGQFGGGWGDDCEMWRWWVPVLIGFDGPKITRAQARFSEAILSQPHMQAGYTTRMSDVEHTAEDSADAITPMMHLDPGNPVWRRRALRLAELMEGLWTGKNDRGFLQFKSTYFTAERVDDDPRRACDTVYHPRAVQPTLLYWQRTGGGDLTRLFSAWMDTWVDAARSTARGKPAGILPTAIHWPDGIIGGTGENWWDPRNHGEYTLYLYPSAMALMTHTLLLTHHMTGREKYLEPIRSMARARLRYLDSPHDSEPEPGSEAWCASHLGGLTGVIAKYRFLTGSTEFDAFLAREKPPYMRLRLRGERDSLVPALERTALALRTNFEGYTSEVRYTDRVLRFPTLFGTDVMFPEAVPGFRSPDTALLYSTVTGDPGGAGYFPLNAVRWLTPPRDIAALVTDSGKDRFGAELFHFGGKERPMGAELYILEPGNYTLRLLPLGGGEPLTRTECRVEGPRTTVSFVLPPRKACLLEVRR